MENDIEYTILSSYKDVNNMIDEIEKHLKKNTHTIEHLNKRIVKLVYIYNIMFFCIYRIIIYINTRIRIKPNRKKY